MIITEHTSIIIHANNIEICYSNLYIMLKNVYVDNKTTYYMNPSIKEHFLGLWPLKKQQRSCDVHAIVCLNACNLSLSLNGCYFGSKYNIDYNNHE